MGVDTEAVSRCSFIGSRRSTRGPDEVGLGEGRRLPANGGLRYLEIGSDSRTFERSGVYSEPEIEARLLVRGSDEFDIEGTKVHLSGENGALVEVTRERLSALSREDGVRVREYVRVQT